MRWRHLHVGKRGDHLAIGGARVWHHEWRWLGIETVRLPDPLIPSEFHSYMVCEIGARQRPARFAAAMLQSGLWSFYVPD